MELRIPGGSPPSSVNSLIEGAEGDLWVGSDAGVIRIPKADLNDPFLATSTAYRLGREQSDEVQVLFRTADGGIWAGTSHGLYNFDGSRFVSMLSSIYVSRIKQTRDGRLLLITGKGVAEYDGRRSVKYLNIGERLGLDDAGIFDLFEDSSGTLWYCTFKGIRAVGDHGFLHLEPDPTASTTTFRATRDSNGVQWVATQRGLFTVVDGQLVGAAVDVSPRAFYVAKDGDLWIGINGSGLSHLQRRTVKMFTKANGLASDLVMTVLPAQDGRLWVGFNCGLEILDGANSRIFNEKNGLANACVWALAEDHKQDIWIGTYGGGLFRYHDGAFKQFSMEQGLASRIVFRVITAQDDSLWIATPDGLSHMTDGIIRSYSIADGLSSNQILDVHQDRSGTIWVATQGGVDRLVGNRFVPVPASPTSEGVLARRFAEDSDGNLFTTDVPKGISRIIDNRLVYQDTPVGLMNMVETSDHSLWFSSHTGVIRFAQGDLTRQRSPETPFNYQQFGQADGLNSSQASVGSPNIAMTRDGKVWVATVGGLAMIDTGKLSPVAIRPKVFVAAATIDGARSRIGEQLDLPPGNHHLELTLAVVNLATPEKIRLQYRLEGVDDKWLDGNASRTVVYTNIPAGPHRLYVRETDSTGHWNEESVVYQIVQRPYFYQKALFQLAALALVLVLLTLAYLVRVDQVVTQTRRILEARQIEREAIARDLHDTFLQGIQGLILHFHSGTRQLPADLPVRKVFEEALQHSDKVLLEGRSILTRITTGRNSYQSLEEAFAEVGHDLRSTSSAKFNVAVSGRTRDVNLVVHEKLCKLGREAIFNAFRHSQASKIEVMLHFGFSEMRLRFCDNGIGIDPAVVQAGAVPGHFGLPGMKARAASLGGTMELRSSPGAGTEIEVRIPRSTAYRSSARSFTFGWLQKLWSGPFK